MKNQNIFKKLFAATVLSATLALGFSPVANAAPRKDVRAAKKNVKEERRDVKQAKKNVKQVKKEVRNNNHYNNHYNNSNRHTFTGTVVSVSSNRRFQLRVGSQTFDVTSSSQLPRGFDRGDTVRVYGMRSGSNNIGNASVAMVNNR